MSIRLITVQSSKNSWLDEASQEFTEKINHFHKFELFQLKSAKKSREDSSSKKKEESELILKNLKADDYVILFDEKGIGLSSKQFSEMIQKLQVSGTKRINFIIGGAFGVDEALKNRAQKTIKIYRAFAIINNKPYHNE
jgi:23S rRNA (pseudouridine1915-N3)-methyltransferase